MADTQKQKEWEAELFRLLVENVKDYAIFILDTQGRVLTWSTGAERLMGYREEEILGEPYSRFFLPAEITSGEPQREMDQAALTGRGEDDRWHIRKDGTIFWCSGVMTPLKDGGGELRGFAKIMRDLTEQKLYEEYRREAEERFHFLVDAVRDYAIFMLDTAGRVVSWNTTRRTQQVSELAAEAQAHSLRLLVVDDNPDAAESLAILLRMHGHDVRVAHSGRAALEAVREQQPQVILLDLGMPEMDGFEVARRLRQELGPDGVVLVAVTGYGQESDRQRSREAGFAFHLTKPADPTQLQYLLQALASRNGGSL